MAMQIGMGFGKFLARVLFQELGVSVPSSVFHVLFNTVSTCMGAFLANQASILYLGTSDVPDFPQFPRSLRQTANHLCVLSLANPQPPETRESKFNLLKTTRYTAHLFSLLSLIHI